MAAYRIAWKVPQKKFKMRRKNSKYEDLDKQKLFFYAFPKNYVPHGHTIRKVDEFAKIFKCKATDRMVINKTEHCAIYGETAPQYKVFRGDLK